MDIDPAAPAPVDTPVLDESLPTVRAALAQHLRTDDVAFSREGATFGFQASAESGLVVGSFVVLASAQGDLLGQIEQLEFVVREGPEVEVTFAAPVRVRSGVVPGGRVRAEVRAVGGGGRLLGLLTDAGLDAYGGPGFGEVPLRRATDDETGRFASSVRGATLEVGSLTSADVPARLVASGFARHTFMVGQSGSGKTYSTGVLLEQLLAKTDLRVVVLDPNSDHVHLDHIPTDESGPDAARLRSVAERVEILRGEGVRMHLRDLDPDLQARLLRLDPLDDRDEYNAFRRMLAMQAESPMDHMPSSESIADPATRAVALRAENLGVAEWSVWGRLDPTSVLHRLDEDDWRALVVDLGSLTMQSERDAVAAAVLGHLWGARARRQPVLIVIDEAHNVAPADTDDPVRSLATDLAVTIAGEGRKFGLHLLVATQRPAKVHPNVVSQCDNLVLMRLNSRSDVDEITRVFSHVPGDMVRAAPAFGLGQALVAGRISPTPQLIRFGRRVTPEGGGDVPTDWATPSR